MTGIIKIVTVNFTNVTNIEIKTEKEYYTSYYDIFGETCDDEKDKKNNVDRLWSMLG